MGILLTEAAAGGGFMIGYMMNIVMIAGVMKKIIALFIRLLAQK